MFISIVPGVLQKNRHALSSGAPTYQGMPSVNKIHPAVQVLASRAVFKGERPGLSPCGLHKTKIECIDFVAHLLLENC
jgi:hypothetical protein